MKPQTKLKRFLEHLLKDRSFLDYWSIIHFVFGMLVGFILKRLNIVFITSFFISFSLVMFWEILEHPIFKYLIKKQFRENIKNQITDIIYGILGFLIYWFYL